MVASTFSVNGPVSACYAAVTIAALSLAYLEWTASCGSLSSLVSSAFSKILTQVLAATAAFAALVSLVLKVCHDWE